MLGATLLISAPCVLAQCLTPDEVKTIIARYNSPPANVSRNKNLHDELLKLRSKDQDMVDKLVAQKNEDKAKQQLSDLRAKTDLRFCEILKEYGWPSANLVGPDGVAAAFTLIQSSPSYRLQRDLLPVIVAAVQKGEIDKPHFAALFDRIRLKAGMKQLFGTQASVINGFLVLEPIEAEAQVDSRRSQFGMAPLAQYQRLLERTYHLPLIRNAAAQSQPSVAQPASLGSAALGGLIKSENGEDAEVLRIETNLVNLNISVFSDKLKTTVSDLEQKDFSVFEDGRKEDLSFFAATSVPFDLVLAIDLSGSTADKRDLIRKSTQRFIEAARPSDRLAIVTFSDAPELVAPLTTDRGQLLASLSRIDAGAGGSSVWDAVKFSLDQLSGPRTTDRRRAVVLMSDGVDNQFSYALDVGSTLRFSELLEIVRHNDAMIIPIYLDTEGGTSGATFQKVMYQNARKTLLLLAEESGGLYYKASKISDLNGVYEQVINDLGKVYSLGYRPTNEKKDGSWRSVRIELLGHPELRARTRTGYYAN